MPKKNLQTSLSPRNHLKTALCRRPPMASDKKLAQLMRENPLTIIIHDDGWLSECNCVSVAVEWEKITPTRASYLLPFFDYKTHTHTKTIKGFDVVTLYNPDHEVAVEVDEPDHWFEHLIHEIPTNWHSHGTGIQGLKDPKGLAEVITTYDVHMVINQTGNILYKNPAYKVPQDCMIWCHGLGTRNTATDTDTQMTQDYSTLNIGSLAKQNRL